MSVDLKEVLSRELRESKRELQSINERLLSLINLVIILERING